MHACSLDEGRALVSVARAKIGSYFTGREFRGSQLRDLKLRERYGVFVTIEAHPGRELRGCIGYLYGFYAVERSLLEASISAAFYDPRFPPLKKEELDRVTIEVSLLSRPESLGDSGKARLDRLVLGRDGLIIDYERRSGLLLPNVATEQSFTKEEFLEAICEKAGVPHGSWRSPDAALQRFETQIFREESPGGNVIEASWKG